MPRILYWNIQKFAINKMTTYTRKRQFGGRPRYGNGVKGDYIVGNVNAVTQAGAALQPDFFVVVEVTTGRQPGGSLITGAGADGVLHLLNRLQTEVNPNWRLVPPLVLGGAGQREGIAVFFRNDLWQFTGPWYWSGAAAQAGAGGAAAYAGVWANVLPADSNTRAGQPSYTNAGGANINFAFPNSRPPFFTKFQQRGVAPARILSLFSFHADSTSPGSVVGTRNLAQIPYIAAGPGANETFVVVGDFNCDLNNNVNIGGGLTQATAYNPLVGQGFQAHVVAADGSTMIKDVGFSTANNPNIATTNGVWPYYDYSRGLSVDNILTRPANPGAPGVTAATIINRITGTPIPANNAVYVNPAMRPVGNRYSIAMNASVQQIIAGTRPGNTRLRKFNANTNFGMIGGRRGASDHLGVLIEF